MTTQVLQISLNEKYQGQFVFSKESISKNIKKKILMAILGGWEGGSVGKGTPKSDNFSSINPRIHIVQEGN